MAPIYTARVESLSTGWAYTATHGQATVGLPSTLLADPLVYRWGFKGGQIPNPLDPAVAQVNLWSRTAAELPPAAVGHLLRLTIYLGLPGDPVAVDTYLRVTEVTGEIDTSHDTYPARQTITAADLLADLGGWFPQRRNAVDQQGRDNLYTAATRRNLAWVGITGSRSIGTPTYWPRDTEVPGTPADDRGRSPSGTRFGGSGDWSKSAAEELAAILRWQLDSGFHYAIVPHYGAAYPAGYEWAKPPITDTGGYWGDPGSTIRYLCMQAGRRPLSAGYRLPLRFANRGGVLQLASSSDTFRHPSVHARHCVVPTTARRGREHAPNTAVAAGVEWYDYDGVTYKSRSGSYEVSSADRAASGPRARTLDSETVLRITGTNGIATNTPELTQVAEVLATYLADSSALAQDWAFDEFEIRAHTMHEADRRAVCPVLVPQYPNAGVDNVLVRHLTIYGLDPRVRTSGPTVRGFIVKGSLTIAGGGMTYKVTITPGLPTPTVESGLTEITLGEFIAVPDHQVMVLPNIDPTIRVDDLALVDNN